MATLTLVSHHLCPYVQRAAISLAEKHVDFERIYVDLSNKPEWFKELSPLGKVPLLRVGKGQNEAVIFESAVILEFLEETQPNALHPHDPLERARHRSWIEFGSSILNRIAAFYNAKTNEALEAEARLLADRFTRVENELGEGPWFSGDRFSLVDAVYGPIFRYFDVFDRIGDFRIFQDRPKTTTWRRTLSTRASITQAVAPDYASRLLAFLRNRGSALSARIS
jgi:glutathione S-transferase